MAARPQAPVLDRIARTYGDPIVEQVGGDLSRAAPEGLFRLLCACILARPRISGWKAVAATRALGDEGWGSAEWLAASPWRARVSALCDAGYTRSPERTALTLGKAAERVRDRYDGDLENLRTVARRDPGTERALLKEMEGLDDSGVDVFFREAQMLWSELYPYMDGRALRAARRLRLPADAETVAGLVGRARFLRTSAALAHIDRSDAYEAVSDGLSGSIDLAGTNGPVAPRVF